MQYYAHSTESKDKTDWQTLSDHLHNVAGLAEKFATTFQAGQWGLYAGLLHDIGKACPAFLARLEGSNIRVDHATIGAKLAKERCGSLGMLLAYVICGHHGGLPDGGIQEGQLHFRLRKETEPVELQPEIDSLSPPAFPFQLEEKWGMFSLAFFTRMLFSCLVDADFLDTENFCTSEKSAQRAAIQPDDMSQLRMNVQAFLAQKQAQAKPGVVNDARQQVLARCLTEAKGEQGVYTLTVPTGGGKTLSSLAFALEHAVEHDLARVIYAIPFTSIIEQNAEVFRQALGEANVLEHHCNFRIEEDKEDSAYAQWRSLAAENWDAPVVVTTNVQFFESLYSNATSRCRKLHNIAGSVIVLDEAQAIPTEFFEPCLAALRELVLRYGCTVVLCTATQPALQDSKLQSLKLPKITELVEDPSALYSDLKRVQVVFLGTLNTEDLAQRLAAHSKVLCIVSTKKQAQQVVRQLPGTEENFHLSTNMYPEHRLRVLATIRQRLSNGLPCRVVSTSLVEAGVDLDFPVVYRAMAGLDSIAQAAGRCNREGKLEYGQTYVYEPDELPAMPWLQRRMTRTRETLRTFSGEDCLSLAPMQRFFELLYDVESLDAKKIIKRLNPKPHQELIFPFREIAEDFRLIDDQGVGVIMPGLAEDQASVALLIEQLRHSPFPQSAAKKLQRYAVVVRTNVLQRLHHQGAVEMIRDTYPYLSNAQAYNEGLGFCEDMTELWDPEYFCI
ncbi:CRISPR-associated helicase Cas3' [Desulfobulbus rhabdoformis]|uniref:CRISPR-associated helicase Cas3' n=1 Tax=Desulfobulbus rhabdoformis TaxID=34032 RepID=UPI0019653FAB|nr:CRISPR-associated helicase Cas3' [Desulfobulbus rhabdoformis]MBM9614798.1 CRISPR-associated helicase Cas3' [Desulfobulbus rhabdoformis]